jgi:hypothetical protein
MSEEAYVSSQLSSRYTAHRFAGVNLKGEIDAHLPSSRSSLNNQGA